MSGHRVRWFTTFAALLPLFLATPSPGAGTQVRVHGADEFRKGALDALSVNASGQLVAAPKVTQVWRTGELYVWSLAQVGGRWVAGTGDGGALYRQDGKEMQPWARTMALEVLSLLPWEDGVLAGTSPDGTVYRVSDDGSVEVALDLPQQSVWDLAPGFEDGWIAALGPGARLVHVSRDEPVGRELLKMPATNATALVRSDEVLWVGTQGPGLIYRLEEDDGATARVVFEAREDEIRAMVSDGLGGLYVLSVAEPGASATPAPAAPAPPSRGPANSNGPSRAPASRLTWIPAEGGVETIHESSERFLSLLRLDDGSLLVGEEKTGRLHRIEPAGTVSLFAELDGGDPVVLAQDEAGRVAVGTGNLGEVIELGSEPARDGTFTSAVLEAPRVSRWGRLTVDRDRADVSFRTRSGFRKSPDQTWSDWSREQSSGAVVASPPAPYLQYRLILSGSRTRSGVSSVRLAYAERNLAPRVDGVRVAEGGTDLVRGGLSSPPAPVSQRFDDGLGVEFTLYPKRTAADPSAVAWARGLRIVRWDATDPNDDTLRHRVEVRREPEGEWLLLQEDLDVSVYAWDTRSFEDGTYRIRVTADDRPSNPDVEHRSASSVSVPIHVDNAPPGVREFRWVPGESIFVASVRDAASPLSEVSIRVDDGPWRPVIPVDGVLDGREEEFRGGQEGLRQGQRLWLRAVDAAGNVTLRERVLQQ